jgi:TonB-linked SusC/RagA family outer membrane protein
VQTNISEIKTNTQMYTIYTNILCWPQRRIPKILLVMKLTAILLFITIMQVSATTYAQRVTLQERNVTLKQLFKTIRQQTGFDVLYQPDKVNDSYSINADFKDTPLKNVLDKALADQPLEFTIEEKTVVIKPKDPSFLDNLKAKTAKLLNLPQDITGKVIDSLGQPLSGASVSLKDTKFNTTTDNKGNFTFSGVPQGKYQLQATYIGYDRLLRNIEVSTETLNLRLILHTATNPLDQVQIIAYGENTQRFNVGSVATVTATQIEQQPQENILLDLQGRVPGLTVTPTSGAPGAAVQVQIRGQNTLANNLNPSPFDQPLFIIDGVPFAPQNNNLNQFNSLASGISYGSLGSAGNIYAGISPFSSINPLDIESITVLKDADATSIYGSQGSNGVILITTKKGKAGKTELNVSLQTGPVTDARDIQMMNTQQYLAMRRQADINDGYPANPTQPFNNPDIFILDPNSNTDWFKQFFGGTANNTIVHASLTGGTANTTFIVSVGNAHQTYNFPGNFADDTYTLHTGFHHNSLDNKLSVDFGTDFSYDQNNSSGAPSVLKAYTLPPNYPALLNPDGSLAWTYRGYNLGTTLFSSNPNPFAYLDQPANLQSYNLNNHLNVSYKLFTGLTLSSIFGYSRLTTQEYSAEPISSQNPVFNPVNMAAFGNSIFQTLDISPQLTFFKQISRGKLSAVVGGEYKKSINSSNSVIGQNYANDALLGSIDGAATVSANDNFNEYKYAGIFGRLNYLWDSKYIINLTGRRDGSSNFGPGRQFGDFGSVGAGWIFSEEGWLKDNKALSFLSYGKLSLTYGTSGGDGVAPYQYQPNWTAQGTSNSFEGIVPYSPTNLFNTDYSWSLTKKTNAALNIGFLKDRILLNLQVYQNTTSNQITSYTLPIQTGYGSVIENFPATVQNRGWEVDVSSVNVKAKDFSWQSSFNISGNSNKLVAFPGLAASPYADQYVIGQSTSEIFGYRYLGVNPQTGLFQFLSANGQPTYHPINNLYAQGGDEVPIENLTPKFFGGFSNTFTYKGFSLMLFFDFSKQIGLNFIGATYQIGRAPGSYYSNQPVQVLDGLWQQPGDIAQFQRLTAGNNSLAGEAASAFQRSTGAYSDASYIKLKTCALAWNIPAEYVKRIGLKSANIYVNAQNLFTITPYQVLDPETAGQIYSFPLQRTIVAGLNLNF